MFYINVILVDFKNIIKWLKIIYRDKEVVKDLKFFGRKYDIVLKLFIIFCVFELFIELEKR